MITVLTQVVLSIVTGVSLACLIWAKTELLAKPLMVCSMVIQGLTFIFQFTVMGFQAAEITGTIRERGELIDEF